MRVAELRVDGNAIAGLLTEVFDREMTGCSGCCDACGAIAPLGATHVYGREPGVTVRCLRCESVLLCVVTARGGHRLSFHRLRWLELESEL